MEQNSEEKLAYLHKIICSNMKMNIEQREIFNKQFCGNIAKKRSIYLMIAKVLFDVRIQICFVLVIIKSGTDSIDLIQEQYWKCLNRNI